MSDLKTRLAKHTARMKELSEYEGEIFGQVVLFDIWLNTTTGARKIEERGRSVVMDHFNALNCYAEIPNPASQLLAFRNEAEHKEVSDELALNVVDPEWLDQLFQCI